MAPRKKKVSASAAAAASERSRAGWQTRRRRAAEEESRKLLAELARWERKQKREEEQRAREAESRKLLAELARWERKRNKGETGPKTTNKARAKPAGGKPTGKRVAGKRGPLPPQSGAISTLDEWRASGAWLQPGARPSVFHIGCDYKSSKSWTKIELAVSVDLPSNVEVSASLLREGALTWIYTGIDPPGMSFLAVEWRHLNAQGKQTGRGGSVTAIDEPEDMEAVRGEMLQRFFHQGDTEVQSDDGQTVG